jgi:hypothetical protein
MRIARLPVGFVSAECAQSGFPPATTEARVVSYPLEILGFGIGRPAATLLLSVNWGVSTSNLRRSETESIASQVSPTVEISDPVDAKCCRLVTRSLICGGSSEIPTDAWLRGVRWANSFLQSKHWFEMANT